MQHPENSSVFILPLDKRLKNHYNTIEQDELLVPWEQGGLSKKSRASRDVLIKMFECIPRLHLCGKPIK